MSLGLMILLAFFFCFIFSSILGKDTEPKDIKPKESKKNNINEQIKPVLDREMLNKAMEELNEKLRQERKEFLDNSSPTILKNLIDKIETEIKSHTTNSPEKYVDNEGFSTFEYAFSIPYIIEL